MEIKLEDACSNPTASAQINIDRLPDWLELQASTTEGCEPLEVKFTVKTDYTSQFLNHISYGGADSIKGNNSYTYKTAGTYNTRLEFRGSGACTTTVQGPEITVHPKPEALFGYSPETPNILKPQVVFENKSTGAESFEWDIEPFGIFTAFSPVINFEDSGKFKVRLIAISDKGCRDTAEDKIWVKGVELLYMPTAFSPNADGLNDVLLPIITGMKVERFAIFNNWGQKIFESNGAGWDGNYKGQPAQQGAYLYMLHISTETGEVKTLSGQVMLMR